MLDFKFTRNDNDTFDILIDSETNQYLTIGIDNSLDDWGICLGTEAMINFQKSGQVSDMTIILLNEISHAILGGQLGNEHFEHEIIYSVSLSYIQALEWIDSKFSNDYKTHIFGQAYSLDSNGIHQINILKILEKWLHGWKKC